MLAPRRTRGGRIARLLPFAPARALALAAALPCLAAAAFPAAARAQSGGPWNLSWNSVDGGGATFSTGGTYSLGGTIGQPDAGTLIGGAFVLRGGFWRGGITSVVTGVDAPGTPDDPTLASLPKSFALHPNSPNPFNPRTTIAYDIPTSRHVRLEIYDVTGSLVRTVVDATLPAGSHTAVWDGSDSSGRPAASGVYLLRLDAETFTDARKIVLAK